MKNKVSAVKVKDEVHPAAGRENFSEIILYQAEDGKSRIEVRLQDETV